MRIDTRQTDNEIVVRSNRRNLQDIEVKNRKLNHRTIYEEKDSQDAA